MLTSLNLKLKLEVTFAVTFEVVLHRPVMTFHLSLKQHLTRRPWTAGDSARTCVCVCVPLFVLPLFSRSDLLSWGKMNVLFLFFNLQYVNKGQWAVFCCGGFELVFGGRADL